jgi:hypothetical protein
MRQRGRKSLAANVVSLSVDGSPPRLTAPSGLSTAERRLFNELISATDPRHFVESDLPLLVSFIQSTLLSRRAASKLTKDPGMVRTWETATRMQATLATRLRLAPQARTDPKTIARQQQHPYHGPKPWDDDDDKNW